MLIVLKTCKPGNFVATKTTAILWSSGFFLKTQNRLKKVALLFTPTREEGCFGLAELMLVWSIRGRNSKYIAQSLTIALLIPIEENFNKVARESFQRSQICALQRLQKNKAIPYMLWTTNRVVAALLSHTSILCPSQCWPSSSHLNSTLQYCFAWFLNIQSSDWTFTETQDSHLCPIPSSPCRSTNASR